MIYVERTFLIIITYTYSTTAITTIYSRIFQNISIENKNEKPTQINVNLYICDRTTQQQPCAIN